MDEKRIKAATLCWVEQFVVGMNFCPFAGAVLRTNRLRMQVSKATDPEQLLEDLLQELQFLSTADPLKWETSLLIHPQVLEDFEDYLDFLEIAEELLVAGNWEGEIQIASFHPDYLFGGEDPASLSHYTNRSLYPMLHLLREDSVEKAIETHPDVEGIPLRNMATLSGKDRDEILKMRQACLNPAS